MQAFYEVKELVKSALTILMAFIFLQLFLPSKVRADAFVLLDSYPAQGQTVKTADLINNPIYMKFNNPVDRTAEGLLRFLDKNANSICQLNMCGIVEYAENNTKVIWHPSDPMLLFEPGKSLEIQIGDPSPAVCPLPPLPCTPVLFRDISGNTLPLTYIDFGMDKCQPTTSLTITYNHWKTCVCGPLGFNCHFDGAGNAATLTASLMNPVCGGSLSVEAKGWFELPDGSIFSLFDPHVTIHVTPGYSASVDLLSYTFTGGEPLGNYRFFLRLLNPITGDVYSTATTSLAFGVCPAIF